MVRKSDQNHSALISNPNTDNFVQVTQLFVSLIRTAQHWSAILPLISADQKKIPRTDQHWSAIMTLLSADQNMWGGGGKVLHHSYFFQIGYYLAFFWIEYHIWNWSLVPENIAHHHHHHPPNFSWFFGYFLAIFGLITMFGSPPPVKRPDLQWKANEKYWPAMNSNMKILQSNEKLMKSKLQWKVIWKFYGEMKS